MVKRARRLMVAGTGSGRGKTTVAMAILRALKDRGLDMAAFKCGPDYIDPMFYARILSSTCGNIDLFLMGEETAKALFALNAREYNLIEGAMGYYDGMSMASHTASAYDVARSLDCQCVLVVDASGMGLSVAAVVKGFLQMRTPSHIAGVILNRVSPGAYAGLKAAIERECGISVYGYMPICPRAELRSRHLGLVTAREVEEFEQKLDILSQQAERTLDMPALISLMDASGPIESKWGDSAGACGMAASTNPQAPIASVDIAVALDGAFCFYYRDDLALLEALGARLIYFSPLDDRRLPDCDGLMLGGGYPELYAEKLALNRSMLGDLNRAVSSGLPTIAECGGFMLLTKDIAGHPMAGVIDARCRDTGKLCRFGYATFTARSDCMLLKKGEGIRGHEFHYWDADDPGTGLVAVKPSGLSWPCAHVSDSLYAGFAHLSLCGAPESAARFIGKCREWRLRRRKESCQ